MLIAVVEYEQKLRRVSQAEVRRQCMANEPARCVQPLETVLDFLVVSRNFDEHSCDLAVRREYDFVYRYQPNPRVFQFTLNQRGDFLPQGLAAARPMIFLCPVLHLCCSTGKKPER